MNTKGISWGLWGAPWVTKGAPKKKKKKKKIKGKTEREKIERKSTCGEGCH